MISNSSIRSYFRNGRTWYSESDVVGSLRTSEHLVRDLPEDDRRIITVVTIRGDTESVADVSVISQDAYERILRVANAPVKRKYTRRVPASRARSDLSYQHFELGRPGNPDPEWLKRYEEGAAWFSEILTMAKDNPQEAHFAMRKALGDLAPYWGRGHAEGFFDRVTRCASAGIYNGRVRPLNFQLPPEG